MKIMITGGTGFVGSHLARKLNENHEVAVGGLNPQESVLELPSSVERRTLDVTDRETLDFSGFDTVIHLVALSPLKKPPVPYREIHVGGTEKVVDQAESDSVEKFFHMSALGASETAQTEYLRTKGEAEKYVEESDLDHRVFRPSVIFGKGGHFLDFVSGLSTPMIAAMPGKNKLFQPIHVEDMAQLIESSLEDRYTDMRFDLGGPDKLTLGQIAEMIEESKGRKLKVLDVPMPLFGTAMAFSEHISFSPFGMDQYRSLKADNIALNNQVEDLGMKIEEMKTLQEYLEEG